MKANTSPLKKVTDTAFWVASYRAIESKKNNPLFVDPLAELLSGKHGNKVSNTMKPVAKYAYWSITIRTRLIDDYLLKYISEGYQTIINLGAGLDTRPYRLSLPSDVRWIELDFPEVIEFKNDKLKDQTANCELERIAVDLSDRSECVRIFSEINDRSGSAIILTEGVIPYLTEELVSSLAKDIHHQPNFELWIAEYYAPEMYARYQSPGFKNLLGDAPFRFFPANWFSFFENNGWNRKEIQYLHDVAAKHNRKFPLPWWASVIRTIIGEKRMMKTMRKYFAYIVFEKKL